MLRLFSMLFAGHRTCRAGYAACALVGLLASAARAEHAALDVASSTITTEGVQKHVSVLADDTFEGREAGSRGGRAAGLYIVKQLEAAGIPGGGAKGSYYQPFGNGYSNILGVLEGRDPQLKQEVLVISAHYDHVGYGTRRNSYGPVGLIHNGADDNASGVAALLKIVEAFSKLPEPPKRTILFAFWDGEEKGLLGSEHWAAQPTIPLNRVRMVINADMVGRLRGNRLEIFGSRTTSGLRRAISSENIEPGLLIDFSWEMKSNSDHYTFFKRQIPSLLVHTGLHGDYHRPSDDAERLNHEGLKQIAQLLFLVVDDLAEAPELAGFREHSQNESPQKQHDTERPQSLPVSRLGLRWNPKSEPGQGVVVTSVDRGGPAAAAGLKPGDHIRHFGGWNVNSPDHFRAMVLAAKNPVVVRVDRSGSDEPVQATVTLLGNPSRLGITWRTDDAEPGVPILNRVLSGSPAEQAGLHVNDRIHRIAGHEFASVDEFRTLAATLPGPIELVVETGGRVRTVILHPADDAAEPARDGDSNANE
jgi:hypothetical protein